MRLAERADLVGEDHLGRVPGIVGVFDRLGGAGIGHVQLAGHILVELLQHPFGLRLGDADDDRARLAIVADRGAFAQELGKDGEAEIDVRFLTGAPLQSRLHHFGHRSRQHGRADDHHMEVGLARKHRADAFADPLHLPEVEIAVGEARRADADQRARTPHDRFAGMGGGPELAAAGALANQLGKAGLDDRRHAVIDHLDLLRIGIDGDDFMAVRRQTSG